MPSAEDTNAQIWNAESVVQEWVLRTSERERPRIAHWQMMADLLPFEASDSFRFLDIGAGTGSAARVVLDSFPNSSALLAEFSRPMIDEGSKALEGYGDRATYVEFDMTAGEWPTKIPADLDAIITSLCIHHIPDERKESLFGEILEHLSPGGWYFNYDPITSLDPSVAAVWQHTNDRSNPEAAHQREHRSHEELARYENHVRYMIPLDQQLGYFRSAGFASVDVYWKHLDNVIYGGCRPS